MEKTFIKQAVLEIFILFFVIIKIRMVRERKGKSVYVCALECVCVRVRVREREKERERETSISCFSLYESRENIFWEFLWRFLQAKSIKWRTKIKHKFGSKIFFYYIIILEIMTSLITLNNIWGFLLKVGLWLRI